MRLLDNVDKCTGCGACESICSRQCISLECDNNGFWYPKIKMENCKDCGACSKVCHLNEEYQNIEKTSQYYACWDINEFERRKGSSGAFFGVIAHWIIENGGCVFGAYLDDSDFSLSHTSSDDVGIDQLKESKYFESSMKNTIDKIRKNLLKNRWVLFCGTPCQVMGVRTCFKDYYKKLVLLDFYCHGVPSAKSFQKYINEIEAKYKKKASSVRFRSKQYGWKTYCMLINFDDGSRYIKLKDEDPFYHFFFSDKCLRPSCYECNRAAYSMADITMGDFWGIYNKTDIPDTDKGISLVAIHTEKGNEIFKGLKKQLKVYSLACQDVEYAYKERKRERNPSFKLDEYHFFDSKNRKKVSMKQKIKGFVTKKMILRKIFYGKWGYLWNKNLKKRKQ